MSFITKKNHAKAVGSNAETIAISKGFIAAAEECQEILNADGLTDEERFDLINFADDLVMKEGRRATREYQDDKEDNEPSGLSAMMRMVEDAMASDDIDFTSERGFNLGVLEGKKRGYRKALTILGAWREEKEHAKAFQMMEHAAKTTSSLLAYWANYFSKQGALAEARLKELKENSPA